MRAILSSDPARPVGLTALVGGALAVLVGGAALAGWAFDVGGLKSIRPDWVTVKPNTAVGFVLIGTVMAVPPEWLPADETALRELHERSVCTPYEKEYVRRDGTRVAVLLADTLLPGADQQIAAFVIDVTERKQAEDKIRRLNAELEQRIAQRTAALAAANRELEAFAYSVSHAALASAVADQPS